MVACLQSSKHEDRKQQQQQQQQLEYLNEKLPKKERSVKVKEKREKLSDEEKELRKERKMGRKRVKLNDNRLRKFFYILFLLQDRAEEAIQAEMKRRREEEKGNIF